jgi:flagellar basal body-associated protein FliL
MMVMMMVMMVVVLVMMMMVMMVVMMVSYDDRYLRAKSNGPDNSRLTATRGPTTPKEPVILRYCLKRVANL